MTKMSFSSGVKLVKNCVEGDFGRVKGVMGREDGLGFSDIKIYWRYFLCLEGAVLM
jgi:hypothetical protein